MNKPTGREEIARQFFIWLLATYDGLSFGTKNKKVIWDFIARSDYDLEALKLGADRILDNMDTRDPFTHGDNRLAASLPESCGAAILKGEEAKREAARMAALSKQAEEQSRQIAAEADALVEKMRREKAENEELAAAL